MNLHCVPPKKVDLGEAASDSEQVPNLRGDRQPFQGQKDDHHRHGDLDRLIHARYVLADSHNRPPKIGPQVTGKQKCPGDIVRLSPGHYRKPLIVAKCCSDYQLDPPAVKAFCPIPDSQRCSLYLQTSKWISFHVVCEQRTYGRLYKAPLCRVGSRKPGCKPLYVAEIPYHTMHTIAALHHCIYNP